MFNFFKKESVVKKSPDIIEETITTRRPEPIFSGLSSSVKRSKSIAEVIAKNMPEPPIGNGSNSIMDDATMGNMTRFGDSISQQHVDYFGSHGFIGYMCCAILSQHWLIEAATTTPVEDALRKRWMLSNNDGDSLEPEVTAKLNKIDKRMNIREIATEFASFGRKFGIRIAIPQIDVSALSIPNNPNANEKEKKRYFYENPFNIDDVTEGSYQGMLMPDPHYITPIPGSHTNDPSHLDFYEPEFWLCGGIRHHKSHCIVYRHAKVAQVIRPSYFYGGVSMTQQIYEAVYNAEVTATEIPKLIQNMRFLVQHMDLSAAIADESFLEKMQWMNEVRSNHDTILLGTEETLEHIQTSLTGMDELVAGRYKIAAAVAKMPVCKLMMTDQTGGLVKGGGEEAVYHETLEVIQSKVLPLLDRHYMLACKSAYGEVVDFDIKFNKLDAMTEKELADLNKLKADTDMVLSQEGAIDALEIRTRIANDPESGYSGLDLSELPEQQEEDLSGMMAGLANVGDAAIYDNRWVTIGGGEEGSGRHVELDDNGNIVKGLGGKFTGKNIKELGGTKKFTKYETNAEREEAKPTDPTPAEASAPELQNNSEKPLNDPQSSAKLSSTSESTEVETKKEDNKMNAQPKKTGGLFGKTPQPRGSAQLNPSAIPIVLGGAMTLKDDNSFKEAMKMIESGAYTPTAKDKEGINRILGVGSEGSLSSEQSERISEINKKIKSADEADNREISYQFGTDKEIPAPLRGMKVTGGKISTVGGVPSVIFKEKVGGRGISAKISGKPELEQAVSEIEAARKDKPALIKERRELSLSGLKELEEAKNNLDDDSDRYHHEFKKMMENGDNDGVSPPKSESQLLLEKANSLAKQYPRAALYLKAKSQYQNTSWADNTGKGGAAKKAMVILEEGGSIEEARNAMGGKEGIKPSPTPEQSGSKTNGESAMKTRINNSAYRAEEINEQIEKLSDDNLMMKNDNRFSLEERKEMTKKRLTVLLEETLNDTQEPQEYRDQAKQMLEQYKEKAPEVVIPKKQQEWVNKGGKFWESPDKKIQRVYVDPIMFDNAGKLAADYGRGEPKAKHKTFIDKSGVVNTDDAVIAYIARENGYKVKR